MVTPAARPREERRAAADSANPELTLGGPVTKANEVAGMGRGLRCSLEGRERIHSAPSRDGRVWAWRESPGGFLRGFLRWIAELGVSVPCRKLQQRSGFRAGWSSSPGDEGGKGRGKFENAGWLELFCYSGQSRASDFLPRRSRLSQSVMTSGLLSGGSSKQWQLRTQGRGFKKRFIENT